MPRAPSDKKAEAEKLFNKGMKLVDISKKLGIPEGTIRSWKNRGKWGEKSSKKNQRNVAKKENEGNATLQKRKRGGQPGNRNAEGSKGGSAPLRNKNAETHGAYSKVYWDALDEDELDLIDSMDDAEEQQLIMQLKMFSVRERRLMRRIKKYRELETENHGLAVKAVSKTKKVEDLTDFDGESIGAGQYKKVTETSTTNTESVMNSIMTLEAELTKVQRAKTRAINSLVKYRSERDKMLLEKKRDEREEDLHSMRKELLDAQIEHMDAQTNKLLGTDIDLEDTSDTDTLIYSQEDPDFGGDINEE